MFISIQSLLIAQNPTEGFPSISNCDNFNAFVDDEATMTTLREYASDISPTGIIRLDPSKANLYSGLDGILSFMNIDDDTNFELVRSTPSRFQGGGTYNRYQQFYKGVEVEGGGFTEYNDNPGGGTYNPCGTTTGIAMSIQTGINIVGAPSIPVEDLESIIQINGNDPEISIGGGNPPKLVISSNLLDDCTYNLAWKVEYFHEGSNIVWVDAQSGQVLKTQKLGNDYTAVEINSNDTHIKYFNTGETILACEGLVLHDMSFGCSPFTTINDVLSAPIIEPNVLTSDIEDRFCCAIEIYNNLLTEGEVMSPVHVGINCEINNAASLPGSTPNNPVLIFDDAFLAIDIIGHELGHTFINQFFTTASQELEIQSIHEGVSDILGIFIESQCSNQAIDWIPNNTANFVRDLANPAFPCITTNSDNESHSFGETLGHWFQLITDGNDDIPAIGFEVALNIVLDALNILDGTATFDTFTDAVKSVVLDQFGPGSDEAHAIWDAFALTCFSDETWIDRFKVNFSGPTSVCKEDGLYITASTDNDPLTKFHWDLPSGWINHGSTSSSLNVSSFPTYPYYPQFFTVCVEVRKYPDGGIDGSETCFQVKLRDCYEKDALTCEEYYNLGLRKQVEIKETSDQIISNEYRNLKVYNFIGQLLFDGPPRMFDNEIDNFSGQIILMVYFDENGEKQFSKKKYINN